VLSKIYIILLGFYSTVLLSHFLLKFKKGLVLIDNLSRRKIHKVAVSRAGGISFVAVTLVFLWFLDKERVFSWYIVGGFSMFFVGLLDDYFQFNWKIKLFSQIVVGLFTSYIFLDKIDLIYFFGYELNIPKVLFMAISLLWFVGIINSVNLVDGLDGLAGGSLMLVCFGGIVLGSYFNLSGFILINLVLFSALLGFLFFNSRPAKYFMGDSGSMFLGYHLAVLPLLFYCSGSIKTLDVTPFIIISTYFILDTIRVFYVRIMDKKHPLKPDNLHLHHELLDATKSYNGTLLIIFIVIAISIIFAFVQVVYELTVMYMIFYLLFLSFIVFVQGSKDLTVSSLASLVKFIRCKVKIFKITLPGFSSELIKYHYYVYLILLFVIAYRVIMLPKYVYILIFLASVLAIFYASLWGGRMVRKQILLAIGGYQLYILNQIEVMGRYQYLIILKYIIFAVIFCLLFYYVLSRLRQYLLRFWSAIDLLVLVFLLFITAFYLIGLPIFGPSFVLISLLEVGVIYLAGQLVI
jgi:UDP-GlcNAc:undecaprenyl-phosphate/decaprenyl-phosphate GlcNAc-1-phosphate transferase